MAEYHIYNAIKITVIPLFPQGQYLISYNTCNELSLLFSYMVTNEIKKIYKNSINRKQRLYKKDDKEEKAKKHIIFK